MTNKKRAFHFPWKARLASEAKEGED